MTHSEIQQSLAVYRDLRGEEREAVDRHVASCAGCAARLDAYRAMDRELSGLRDARPDRRLRQGYYAALDARPTRPGRRPQALAVGAPLAASVLVVALAVGWAVWQGHLPGPARRTSQASEVAMATPRSGTMATPRLTETPAPIRTSGANAIIPGPTNPTTASPTTCTAASSICAGGSAPLTLAQPTPTPRPPSDWETTQVTLDIFSGRPNPAWALTAAQDQELRALLAQLPEAACRPMDLPLGYRGFVVLVGQRPELSNEYRLRVYASQVRWGDPWAPQAPAACRSDPGRQVERFLLDSGDAALTADVRGLVMMALAPSATATP